MFEDSHDWVLFMAGRDMGKTSSEAVFLPCPRWATKLQARISRSLTGKTRPTWERELGYTVDELRLHLERQFATGMGWDNYAGNRGWRAQDVWVIDHILPKSLFRYDEAKQAFSLSNLRPVWLKANLAKGARREHLV